MVLDELVLPPGVTPTGVTPASFNAVTGDAVSTHHYRIFDSVTGETFKLKLVDDGTASKAHAEDMIAAAYERWLIDVRLKHGKGLKKPTPEQKKEIGRILDDIRLKKIKRKESSTGRIYYAGTNV